MTSDEIYAVQPDAAGWRTLPYGTRVKLGNWVTLGDGVVFMHTPMQVQCDPYIVFPYSNTHIGVGCVIKSIADWRATPEPPELNHHPECRPWATYARAIDLVALWLSEQAAAQL